MENQNEQTSVDKKKELEGLIKEAKSEKRKGWLKAIGGLLLPPALCVGLGFGTVYAFDNRDLGTLVSMGVGFAMGVFVGSDYVEAMRNIFSDLRETYQRIRGYRRELQFVGLNELIPTDMPVEKSYGNLFIPEKHEPRPIINPINLPKEDE